MFLLVRRKGAIACLSAGSVVQVDGGGLGGLGDFSGQFALFVQLVHVILVGRFQVHDLFLQLDYGGGFLCDLCFVHQIRVLKIK